MEIAFFNNLKILSTTASWIIIAIIMWIRVVPIIMQTSWITVATIRWYLEVSIIRAYMEWVKDRC